MLPSVSLQLSYSVPLVKPGEDELARPAPFVFFNVNEAGQDVEPGVARPDALPQIGGAVAIGIGRIAGSEVVAEVEGQEPRGRAGQPGRHDDVVGVDREVDGRALAQ